MSYDAWKAAAPEGEELAAWGEDEPSESFDGHGDFAVEALFAELCALSDEEDARIRAAGSDPRHECQGAVCAECA